MSTDLDNPILIKTTDEPLNVETQLMEVDDIKEIDGIEEPTLTRTECYFFINDVLRDLLLGKSRDEKIDILREFHDAIFDVINERVESEGLTIAEVFPDEDPYFDDFANDFSRTPIKTPQYNKCIFCTANCQLHHELCLQCYRNQRKY